ncbi:unnamed protein product, partial [Anisakis simplex]|uniref:Peptide-methionine (R)-S-oxide reductase n=1 Tax=Anisakis simplex TaxID=6269 RepID=A0A0M3JJN4_ANISI
MQHFSRPFTAVKFRKVTVYEYEEKTEMLRKKDDVVPAAAGRAIIEQEKQR